MLTNDKIRDNLCNAMRTFYDKDSVLIEYQVAERALTHKLAEYLQELFPDYNVDCEYNKVGNGDPKRIDLLMKAQQDCPQDCNKCAANKCVVFPDIIVHKRGRDENILSLGLDAHNALYDVYSILEGLRYFNNYPITR